MLGRLGTSSPLGGEIRLDGGRARGAVERLGSDLGVELVPMAEGIVKLAVARMTGAIDREHCLVLDLAPVSVEPADVVGKQDDARLRHGRGVDSEQARVGVERADDARMQYPGQLEVFLIAGCAGGARVDHAASSSSARRTSTAITRRRYPDEPLTSLIGSIASA